jgi:hypothetical protein
MNRPLTFTAEESYSTINLSKYGSPTIDGLQYRLNKSDEWIRYKLGIVIVLENVGDYVQFQNTNNELSISYYNFVRFVMTGKIAASGNIMSLLNYSDSCQPYCFYEMFRDCSVLTKAPELPASNLADSCYAGMFIHCTSLTKAPKLSATTLAENCYSSMFWYCTSLVEAPELSATNLANGCYFSMFYNCTSLVKVPKLPAINLANWCYSDMFNNCISLTKAPKLSATILADNCYSDMFKGCANLKNKPKINRLIEKMVYIY